MTEEELKEKRKKRNKLAKEIMELSRNTLLVNLRFLDLSLNELMLVRYKNEAMATDGIGLFYDAGRVLKSYKEEETAVTRDYLHALLHCVFNHMFVSPAIDKGCWDLACDIAVEYAISEMNLSAVTTRREVLQKKLFSDLKSALKSLTAERIYRFFMNQNLTEMQLANVRALVYADDHFLWYMKTEAKLAQLISMDDIDGENIAVTVDADSVKISGNDIIDDGGMEEYLNKALNNDAVSLKELWEELSKRMEVEIESFSRKNGNGKGSLFQNLKELNRERYDYGEFLRKFSVMGEAMKVNDDEFDYIYYTYGLKLYDKMPLIEPLEYKEVKRIKEFVIAIDTSGSVSGKVVQAFIQKTFNILKSSESFFSKINLHIIQCDADVQEHVKITNQEEFDLYIKNMKIRGLGGTDFRPVFELTDKLISEKEFTNLKGLIYFTDGFGTFPSKKPDYETAFVFLENEDNNEKGVPAWAIKLILPEEEFLKEA